jgi:hypothetical protein
MSPRLEHLSTVGRALYGDHWIGAMSVALGPLNSKNPKTRLQETTVRRWAQQQYEVPEWVDGALPKLLEAHIETMTKTLEDIR